MSYFIKQIGTKDCSFACVKMLLAIVYKNKKFLFYPQAKKDESYSLLDIIKIARNEGVELKGFKYVNKESFFTQKRYPILVVLKENNFLHMVLVKKIKRKKVVIYDPKIGIYELKKNRFIELWNSEILEIESVGEYKYKENNFSPIPLKFKVLSYFFQIISLATLLSAMFFSNESYNFYVPLLLLVAFVISELAFKKVLISSMKEFDAHIIDRVFDDKKKMFKDKYIEMNKFKSLLLSRPIQLINSIMVVVIGLIVLSINSYLNIVNIALVISISVILEIIQYKYFINRENIEVQENELLESSNSIGYRNTLISLQNKVYKRVTFISYKKYLITFLIGVICLVYASFSGEISLNFILFHSFIYLYINDNVVNILKIYYETPDYKYSKCLYKYYCDEI